VTAYIPRRAARVLVVDGGGRLLMFRGFDPARPQHRYWFTVGGGIDAGESMVDGAVRELHEETGLRLCAADLGEPVFHDVTRYPFGGDWYQQEQDFYLVRVDTLEVRVDGFEQMERESIDGYRWWTAAELASTTERYYPEELPALLARLVGR